MKFVCGTLAPHTFDDIRDAVTCALRSAGHDAVALSYSSSWPLDRTAIVLGAHDFGFDRPHPLAVRPPPESILYDLEQPFPLYVDAIVKAARMLRAKTVWSWSEAMTVKLRDLLFEINVEHVPFGCVPEMKRLRKVDQDIDVFFYGHLTERRTKVLDACRALGLRVEASGDCWGPERDSFIERAKVVLNVHKWDGEFEVEAVRLAFLIANGKCVVSERGTGWERFQGAVAIGDLEHLSVLCLHYARDDANRSLIEADALERSEELKLQLPFLGETMHDSVLAWADRTTKKLALRSAGPVLEVGSCNVNGSVRQFFGKDYIGVDIEEGPGVDVVVSPVHLPFPNQQFAVVVSTEMLEHAAFPALVLSEMRRVLKSGGTLLLTTRSEGFPFHNPPDYFRYSVDQMRDLLTWLGFDRISVEVDSDPRHPGVFAVARKPMEVDWTPPLYGVAEACSGKSMTLDDWLPIETAEKLHTYLAVEMPDSWWSRAVSRSTMIPDTLEHVGENERRREIERAAATAGQFGYYFRRAAPHVSTCYCVLCGALAALGDPTIIRHISDEMEIPLSKLELHFASCYEPGDFLSAHTDKGNGKVAFVWNLTKNWRPQYGGLLHLLSSDWARIESTINPAFNSLVLFDVRGEGRAHFVSEVIAGVTEKRLAISGWFS
jgi:SAM-dependent methyltransferase